MTRFDYTYVPIRYVHDPTSGETLNVGILLCAPEAGYVRCRLDHRMHRLREAFGGFSAYLHRGALRSLRVAVQRVGSDFAAGQKPLFTSLENAEDVLRYIWPDLGTQYVAGPLMFGSDHDLDAALEGHFERLVTSQQPLLQESRGREDNDVWNTVAPTLRERDLLRVLTGRTVSTEDGPLRFDHTYQNGTLHVVQPLSFDLAAEDSLLRKAHVWFGRGDTMYRTETFGSLLFVLGPPKRKELLAEYDRCRRILERMPLKPEMYEEKDAEALATGIQSHWLS